jgi:hypothetical protein
MFVQRAIHEDGITAMLKFEAELLREIMPGPRNGNRFSHRQQRNLWE